VLEAMSCGAPVITSPAGAVPEVVGDMGVFLPEPTPEAISRAILELWPDEDRRGELGLKGRRRAEELFSIDARKERIRGLLEE
jgi:glycosyltransferase involved in cell wall biosynthesis